MSARRVCPCSKFVWPFAGSLVISWLACLKMAALFGHDPGLAPKIAPKLRFRYQPFVCRPPRFLASRSVCLAGRGRAAHNKRANARLSDIAGHDNSKGLIKVTAKAETCQVNFGRHSELSRVTHPDDDKTA